MGERFNCHRLECVVGRNVLEDLGRGECDSVLLTQVQSIGRSSKMWRYNGTRLVVSQ